MKQKILLVDDYEPLGVLLRKYFESYDVTHVMNGLQAIEWLQDHDVDLIITDIRMPQMNGIKLFNYLKNNELFNHIPVIILSSEENTSERIDLLERGAVDYILKPFNPRELLIRVGKALKPGP
ncbi:MAG: response regulator [Mediterranea sp.]|jgi:DNA-binding response OmpR family regulator|nr:response regulator [Mediterranea sp.]